MARRCIFCGGTPVTREHVVPRWLTAVLPEQARFRGQDQQFVLQPPGGPRSGLVLPHREMREPFNAMTVKAVCSKCNGGWMSRLEEVARPVLAPLIRGESQQFEIGNVETIATWTVKTALMAQLTGVEYSAGLGPVYRTLYNERKPPHNSVVWVAATGAEDWGLRFEIVGALIAMEEESNSIEPDDPVNTISVTIGLGNLLLHTVLTVRNKVSYPPLDEIHSGAIKRLWPDPTAMTLPPPHWLINEAAWMLSRSFAFWYSQE
jgi:hypothetical protein